METITTAALSNRRKSQRRRPRTTVQVQCRKGASGLGANVACSTLDLSETGARLIVSQELDIRGDVEIVVGGYGMKKPIKRMATIRWQLKLEDGRFCIGTEFQKRLDYRDWQNLASPH
jgi:PilZ domain